MDSIEEVYNATKDHHITVEKQLNQPEVTVKAGLSCKSVIGPIIEHTAINQPEVTVWAGLSCKSVIGPIIEHTAINQPEVTAWAGLSCKSVIGPIIKHTAINQPDVTALAGLSCKSVIGPIIEHTAINQAVYLNMLKDIIMLRTREQYQDDDFNLQQYEVPPHYALSVCTLFDKKSQQID